MRRTRPSARLQIAAAAMWCAAAPAIAATVLEHERNDSFAEAQILDAHFSLGPDPDIGFALYDVPHVTVVAGGDNDLGEPDAYPNGFTYDVFRFTVATPGSLGYFDIDYAAPFGFNAVLSLFDASGVLIAASDDAAPAGPVEGGGSLSNQDPFLIHAFSSPGNYFIRVGACCEGPLLSGDYELQISVQNHALGAVPEPAAWAIMIAGFAVAGGMLRGRRGCLP